MNVASSTFLGDTEEKIKSFAGLPRGWDYGHGGPIPERTLRAARAWNILLQSIGFSGTDAFPGGANEVVVAADSGDHYLEVIVEPDGTISIAYDYQHKQKLYKSHLSEDAAEEIVRALARGLWSASDYFTLISTTQNNVSSPDLLSGTLMVDYPWSAGIAFNNLETRSVNTFDNTINAIQGSWGSRPYSGNLTPTPFLPGIWSNRLRRIQEISATMT